VAAKMSLPPITIIFHRLRALRPHARRS
jgi:hypothetical protein